MEGEISDTLTRRKETASWKRVNIRMWEKLIIEIIQNLEKEEAAAGM